MGSRRFVSPPVHADKVLKSPPQVWPEIDLHIVPDAGHSSREPGISKKLVEATDKYADL
jgi:hypothetical protein